ncbi:MAG: histidine kinase dimerization/phospho-acceptor domain-containing protein, partial [Planctomycetota bacterium]
MTGFAKVFGAAALVVTVTVAVVYGLALSGLRERDAAHVTAQLQTEAQLAAAALRPTLLADNPAQLAAELARLSGLLPGRRLTAVAADGRALADTHEAAESLGNLLERPEIRAARGLEARPGATRTSRLSESPRRDEAAAIRDGERLLGFVVLSLSEADLLSEEQLLHKAILQAAILALLTGAIAAALLARSVQRPIRELSDYVEAVARGESPPRLLDEGRGELAELRVALDDMSTRLGARFQRIARDESEIRAIVGSMEEGVLAVDGQLRAVLVNAAAGRLLGFDAARAQGRLVWELTRLPQVAGLLERCLRDQRATVGETLLAGEPHDRVLGLTATPLGSAEAASGQAWGCVLVLRDLTEVRRLEQVRRDFVVNVSHELKTPLTSLRGFLDAVLDDPALDAGTRQHFLERARVNNERMIAIVGDLLSLARVEAETGVPRAEALDLRDLAREARGALLSLAAEREMQILL